MMKHEVFQHCYSLHTAFVISPLVLVFKNLVSGLEKDQKKTGLLYPLITPSKTAKDHAIWWKTDWDIQIFVKNR